jgi:hypothetical protein
MFSTNVHLRSIISSLEEQPLPNLHFIFKFLFVQIASSPCRPPRPRGGCNRRSTWRWSRPGWDDPRAIVKLPEIWKKLNFLLKSVFFYSAQVKGHKMFSLCSTKFDYYMKRIKLRIEAYTNNLLNTNNESQLQTVTL